MTNGIHSIPSIRGFGSNYPPFGYLFVVPFTILGTDLGIWVYFLFFAITFPLLCWHLFQMGKLRFTPELKSIILIILLSYLFHFALDRLNAENLLFTLVAAFFLAFQKNRHRLAIWFLGAAIAAKVYPCLFLAFYLSQKQYHYIVKSILIAIGFTCLAFLMFGLTPQEMMQAYKISSPAFMAYTLSASPLQHCS